MCLLAFDEWNKLYLRPPYEYAGLRHSLKICSNWPLRKMCGLGPLIVCSCSNWGTWTTNTAADVAPATLINCCQMLLNKASSPQQYSVEIIHLIDITHTQYIDLSLADSQKCSSALPAHEGSWVYAGSQHWALWEEDRTYKRWRKWGGDRIYNISLAWDPTGETAEIHSNRLGHLWAIINGNNNRIKLIDQLLGKCESASASGDKRMGMIYF